MLNKLIKIAKNNPHLVAYKVDNKEITYKELLCEAMYYSDLLKREGTSPVIIYGHKEVDMIVSIVSCLLANRTYIPVELGTPEHRIQEIIDLSNSSLILSKHKLEGIKTTKLKDLEKYKDNEINKIENDIVYIIFTSGSTGAPKGVPISKENLDNFVKWISSNKILSKYKNINVLNNASFSFDLSVADIYYSLCNGHTLVGYNFNITEEYEKIFDVYKKNNINYSVMTPTTIKLCLLNPDFNSTNFPDLDCIYFCGEQLDKKVVKKLFNSFPNIKIINAYGPTEATSAVSAITIDKEMLKYNYLPVGEIDSSAVDIVLKSDEIILKGKSVFSGYISLKSPNCYKENGINCYKTGDLGFIYNNRLYCIGRKDNQIKYKGFRIELGEIENNLKSLDKVRDAIVIAKHNDNGLVSTIKAFVITNLTEDEIKEELSKELPHYMIPKSIVIMKKFPINKNGKIDGKELSKL